MRRLALGVLCCYLVVPTAEGSENALRIRDDGLRYWNRVFQIWGIELEDWPRLVTDPEAIRQTFQPWGDHGVNTVGYALQRPGNKTRFFTPDGQPASKQSAAQFTRVTRTVRDHHLTSVVSLFSADRACWLSSPDAYRSAARHAAKALGSKHSVIFIAGDLFGTGSWSPDCPYLLNDPANAIEICQVINQTDPEALVGIPADIVPAPPNSAGPPPLFYAAATADALNRLIVPAGNTSQKGDVGNGIVTLHDDRLFRYRDAAGSPDEAVRRYVRSVEQRRLAIRAPVKTPKDPAPNNMLTPEEKAAGFVPIFDGRTLEGWTTLLPDWSVWSVENGAIRCSGESGQWLRTRKRFASFILRFEYKITAKGNSGVFVWAPLAGRSSRFGMEMQIRGLRRDKLNDDCTGAIYDVLPPREDPSNPAGQWNRVEIACRGSHVKVSVNETVVQDIDADEVPKLKGRLRRGVIGLQDHGNEVWFRNIRIRELKS